MSLAIHNQIAPQKSTLIFIQSVLTRLGAGSLVSASSSLFLLLATKNAYTTKLKVCRKF